MTGARPWTPRAAPRFRDVRQAVRAYRPTDLVPALARVACTVSDPEADSLDRWRRLSPWGLAALARESLLHGTEHRPARRVADEDVHSLHNRFAFAYDPRPRSEQDVVLGILARTAHEQFPYQESDGEELARSYNLLWRALPLADTTLLTPATVNRLVGGPLVEVMRATQLLYGAVQSNRGLWISGWWTTPEANELTAETPAARVLDLADRLTADMPAMREDHRNVPGAPPHLLRYDYNPLERHPLALLPNGDVVAPMPRLVLTRMSPRGLYYAGIAEFGGGFPDDLGKAVEQYVGLLLESVPGAHIEGEIEYRKGALTVDWFWHHHDTLVLVEVKGMRPTLGARIGAPGFPHGLAERLGVAVNQLNRTASLLDQPHPELRHLPTTTNRIGLIVTAEPIYVANSPDMRQYLVAGTMPTLVVSLRDLERLVALDADTIFTALAAIGADPELQTWPLPMALGKTVKNSDPGRAAVVEQAMTDIYIA